MLRQMCCITCLQGMKTTNRFHPRQIADEVSRSHFMLQDFFFNRGFFGYKFHGFPDFQFQWYLCFNWNIPIFMDIMDLRFKSTLSLWYSNFIFWIFSIKNAEKCKTWDPATGTLPETNSQLETAESWCSWKKSLLSASFWSRMPSF